MLHTGEVMNTPNTELEKFFSWAKKKAAEWLHRLCENDSTSYTFVHTLNFLLGAAHTQCTDVVTS